MDLHRPWSFGDLKKLEFFGRKDWIFGDIMIGEIINHMLNSSFLISCFLLAVVGACTRSLEKSFFGFSGLLHVDLARQMDQWMIVARVMTFSY